MNLMGSCPRKISNAEPQELWPLFLTKLPINLCLGPGEITKSLEYSFPGPWQALEDYGVQEI